MPRSNRLLLDTHVFLWWRLDDPRLGEQVRTAISQAEVVFVSAASAWEIAIKSALGKLRLSESVAAGVEASDFMPLPIVLAHAEAAGALPPHHRDPFDRMLVVQAIEERLTLVSHDHRLKAYGVEMLSV